MADDAAQDRVDSPVGRVLAQASKPGGAPKKAGDKPPALQNSPGYGLQATGHSPASFDPGELFSELQDLLALYLARAKDAQAVADMPAKDAISCAKTTTEMMSALQAGKLAAVDAATQWPRMESGLIAGGAGVLLGGAGVPPVIPHRPPARRRCHLRFSSVGRVPCGAPKTAGYETPPYSPSSLPATRPSLLPHAIPLAEFVAQICRPDDEVDVLEPYQRLVARINRLSDMCEEWLENRDEKSSVALPAVAGRRPAVSEDSRRGTSPRPTVPSSLPATRPSFPPPTSSFLPPTGANAPRALKRRRTLYTFGSSLRSNSQQPTTNNRGRSAPQSPT